MCAFYLLGWLPGYALIGSSLGSRAWRVGASLALAPIWSTALIILQVMGGVKFEWAVLTPALVMAPFTMMRLRGDSGDRDDDEPRARRQVFLLAAGAAIVIALVYLLNPWLSWRADGRFHIGVVGEMLRGGLPPTDPFFAGLNLQYMWFFHAYVAGLKALSGLPTPTLLALVNVVCLFAFVLLVWETARGFGRPPKEALMAAVLTAFAMGGHGWIFLGIKLLGAFRGTETGWAAVRDVFNIWPPRVATALGMFSIAMDQAFLLRKFLVGTAMSLALIAFYLHLESSRRMVFSKAGNPIVTAIAAAGAIVLHPMMGLPAVAVVCGASIAWLVWDRIRPFEDGRPAVGKVVWLIAANVAGAALAYPYLKLVTSGKEGVAGLPIDAYPLKIVSLVAGTLGVGALAAWWILRVLRERHPRRVEVWAALWSVLLVLFTFFVRFPLERENIDKPTLLSHMALALPAGWVLGMLLDSAERKKRRWGMIYLVLMIVPLNVIGVMGYLGEPDPRTYRAHEKEAFRFIDTTAPKDALVFDSQDRDRPAVEIQRRQYWGHEQFATTHEYPKVEIDARRALRDGLYRFGGPDAEIENRLATLGAPVYVIVRAGAAVPGPGFPPGTGPTDGSFAKGDPDPLADHPRFERVYDSDDVRVYRLR